MPSLVVVGAQWGDEGKGKLVDYLTSNATWVARFQGGNNAGHTLVIDGVKTKLSLVPSGILRPKTRCAIGAGAVVDPYVLLKELEGLRAVGVDTSPERLLIDRDAHLVLDYHIQIDQAREVMLGDQKIGTTGRGIGPAYEDRSARCGVRFADFFDRPALKERLQQLVANKNLQLQHVLQSPVQVDFAQLWSKLEAAMQVLSPHVANVSLVLDEAIRRGEHVVFEGAQGTLLDQMHGTIPYVTSSNTIAGAVLTGCGIGAKHIHHVLGVAKAYCTRVGAGPFPTEDEGSDGDRIRERGAEFGTVTGRPRRCGWFDAVAMRRAVRLNGIDSLAVTKLDVLAGFDRIKMCVKYELDGREVHDVPALASECERIVPHYIELEGWGEEIKDAKKWHHLPSSARLYLSILAEIVGAPVSMVSVGAERESTLFSSAGDFVRNFSQTV